MLCDNTSLYLQKYIYVFWIIMVYKFNNCWFINSCSSFIYYRQKLNFKKFVIEFIPKLNDKK